MNEMADCQIEVEAARALVDWKSLFADEIVAGARRLAMESGQPRRVALSHYRQAAQRALAALSVAIQGGGTSSGDNKAA